MQAVLIIVEEIFVLMGARDYSIINNNHSHL